MKLKKLVSIASIMAASLAGAGAAVNLTAWNFENVAIGASASPAPSTGFGTASAIGGLNNPDVQSLAGSSSGGAKAWRVRATGGNAGWSTSAAIGSQGARFRASTAGFYRINVSFDVYATSDAESALQVQYTTDGNIWNNANITSAGTQGNLASNASTTNSLVVGSYLVLTNSGWNNGVTVDLSGVSGVDNDANFAVRIVNAATGTNCFAVNGALYNNVSGDWTLDNVVASGTAIDTIADWTFESYGVTSFVPHPVPEFNNSISPPVANSIGMDNTYSYSDGTSHSTNAPDTLAQAGSSTPSGTTCWRVRGAGPSNGWNSQAPVGTQGGEFNVNTMNYSNIVLTFDLYFTTQGEAKFCVLYTTNGWVTTNVANNLAYPANPTFILVNDPANFDYSPNTVTGTYFFQTTGQNWYNNLVVDFTGIAGADNNPNFGVRIVNAATGSDCINFTGGSYNNSSGNTRFDNVSFGGQFAGSTPPVLAYDPNATVDRPFTNTFTDDPAWRGAITSVFVNGLLLTNTAYTTSSGKIVYNPTNSVLLQTAGTLNIVIFATGYGSDKVTQPIVAGVPSKFSITQQPAAPSASGGTLTVNPILALTDKYGNGTTNGFPSISVTAKPSAPGWSLGGDTNQPCGGGFVYFTNLTATSAVAAGTNGAKITFTISGYAPLTTTNSAAFNIGPTPVNFTQGDLAVMQIDTVANNTTFSFIELKPSAANQTAPVNIVPITATGTNALRMAPAGSAGKVSLSDDGTLICFNAFADGSSLTADETFNLNRAVGTLNASNNLNIVLTYTSSSLGGSQARSACTLDNVNFIADDKGGLYYGSLAGSVNNINANNNIVVRTFGGIPYVETQKTANGSPIPVVYSLNPGDPTITVPNNLTTDPIAVDFYLVSTNAGSTYDVMYVLDQVSAAQGVIKKYSLVPDGGQISGYAWQANGTWTNGTSADCLYATTNGSGGVYLYYVSGNGATAGNAIYRITDQSGWGQNMSVTSSNLIYTAPKTASLRGLVSVPKVAATNAWLTAPPILLAQTFAATNSTFTVTNIPDDSAWRSAITSITVNGSTLAPAAYNVTQSGKIVFDPSQSALLQSPGSKAIVVAATGYSTNTITQVVAGVPAKLTITTQPKAPVFDGGPLTTNSVVQVQDASGNPVFSTAIITAQVGAGIWILGGTTNKAAVNGTATYNNLTAFGNAAVPGATTTFTASGLASVTSSTFNIPAPAIATLNNLRTVGGKTVFSFTNYTGLSFSVLATNNIAAPKNTWPAIGTALENGTSGIYWFTNSSPATNAALFYLLRQP
jgi:hypothetical protein